MPDRPDSRFDAQVRSQLDAQPGSTHEAPLDSTLDGQLVANNDWRDEIRRRLKGLSLSPAREAEVVEELSQHLDDRYRDLVAGRPVDRAADDTTSSRAADAASLNNVRQTVLADLDGSDVLARELRRLEQPVPPDPIVLGGRGRTMWLGALWQDVRYGLRSWRKNPGFAIVAILMLALGTGANAAMFSVVDAVLLAGQFPDPDRIVIVRQRRAGVDAGALNAKPDELRGLQRTTDVFADVSGFGLAVPILTGLGDPHRVLVECASTSIFRVLGVEPVLGRAFSKDDDRPGASPVVVVSDAFWRGALAANPAVIGQTITLNNTATTIVGVMPAGFDGVRAVTVADAWAPIGASDDRPDALGCHASTGMNVYARLRSDLTMTSAQARLDGVSDRRLGLVRLDSSVTDDFRPVLLTLLGAVGLVLLIACANVANVLLERALGRRAEIAVRIALGASPGRLVRQLLTESVLLAMFGAAAGLVVAGVTMGALVSLMPLGVPHLTHIVLSARAMIVTLGVSVLAGVCAGLVPALQLAGPGVASALKDARSATAPHRQWMRRSLIVGELALSVALLIGAALMIRTFLTLMPRQPGFDPAHKITALVQLSGARYEKAFEQLAFVDALTSRLRALPGVAGVSVVNDVPVSGFKSTIGVILQSRPETADGHTWVFNPIVTTNYFEEMRITLLRGRMFTDADDARAPQVAIVNEAMVRRFWPARDPIGTELTLVSYKGESIVRRIIGISRDVRTFGSDTRTRAEAYVPLSQSPTGYLNFIVRTGEGDRIPADLTSGIRAAVAHVDSTQVVDRVESLDRILSRAVASSRFVTLLMTAFALMAVGLAVVGLAAVMAWSVAQRTREIGVRVALGATSANVVQLILKQALGLSLAGIAIGLSVAALSTRLLSDWLYGVKPLDAMTFGACAVLMFLVAMLASYVPASRATKVDPLRALRDS